jgi:C-terminal processing protease CtpA/Prc
MGTASYGEVFAGVLKDLDRAYLIGETTGGNVETLWGYDFDDGSRAWIAHESFRPLNHPDENWEESGVVPHLTVLSNWDEVTVETDPAVIAALEHFDQ